MKLSDIIQNDNDRLFIVDTECFIVFTGGSINDDRPFIRIGTWSDLPVEIIPLVENIIISDRILGNPALEQFNINVRNLTTNRYIGGESILKRFLDYQRNFGLDLTNVSAVNIEKDIPELPDKKHISDRDQFIGVFYSDGNVKIVHDGNNIFDLNSIYNENLNITEILTRLTQNNKTCSRYSGAGFAVSDKNPIFYSDGYFTSYQFPKTYADDFSILEIDPGKIRELLLPSHNMLYVSDIMKLKHFREGKIRIFSDNRDQLDLIKRLFKGATIHDEPFSEMNYSTGNGITISAHSSTPNIKINWNADAKRGKNLTLYFIKSPAEVKSILKEPSDAIIISYTAYEQSVLLFKSVQKPVIILNDGNRNVKKISETDNIILKDGMQYELKHYDSIESLQNTIESDPDFNKALTDGDITSLENWFESDFSSASDYFKLFNSLALLKIQMDTTKDRKLFSSLRSLIQKQGQILFRHQPDDLNYRAFFEIAICNNTAFQIIRSVTRKSDIHFTQVYDHQSINNLSLDSDQQRLGKRIIEDRERLAKILTLFYEDKLTHPSFNFMKSELSLLKEEIDSRREIYNTEFYEAESFNSHKNKKKKTKTAGVLSFLNERKNGAENINGSPENAPEERSLNIKKIKISAAVLLLLLLLLSGGIYITKNSGNQKPVLTEQDLTGGIDKEKIENKNIIITVKRVDEQEKELLKLHNVKITDYDIFRYANDVAIKNGYSGLTMSGLKDKNPHWIYPSNVFIMLDGEKVVVQKGDTLWDLAHAKLEKMNAEFYKITDQLEKTDPEDTGRIKAIIAEAEKYLYTVQQKKYIDNYKTQNLKNE
ncbi:MAG TPA: hypothetical protein PKZ64_06805 [Spirochaetota bacterium]|nr:hypothetical protein [Spirochaetota bacterium]